ncbi:MAG: uroporphyrinogen-III synthase [Rhodospirillaceae bacterium]
MRALVTRPAADATRLSETLSAQGLEVLIEPLLVILPVAGPQTEIEGLAGVLLTSANGARAMAAASSRRDLPVYAVGETTARTARSLGYGHVETAGGDVKALAALVQAKVDPNAGPLLHAVGSAQAGDLAGTLAVQGYDVRKAILYESRAATALSKETREALGTGDIDLVVLYSPRTAAVFSELVQNADLTGACKTLTAYALSPAVAAALKGLPLSAVRTAAEPTETALLSLLADDLANGRVQGGSGSDTMATKVPVRNGSISPEDKNGGPTGATPGQAHSATTGPDSAMSLKEPGGDSPVMTDSTKDDVVKNDADSAEPKADGTTPEASEAEISAPESGSAETDSSATDSSSDSTPESPWGSKKDSTDSAAGDEESDALYGRSSDDKSDTGTDLTPDADDGAGGGASDGTPAKSGGGKGCLWIILLVILIGAGTAGSYPWWRDKMPEAYKAWLPPLPQSAETQAVAALTARLDAVEGEIATLQAAGDAGSEAAEQISAISGSVESLSGRLADLETQITEVMEAAEASAAAAPMGGEAPSFTPTDTDAGTAAGETATAAATPSASPSGAAGATSNSGASAAAVAEAQQAISLMDREVDVLKGFMDNTKTDLGTIREELSALAGSLETVGEELEGLDEDKASASQVLALTGRLVDVEDLAKQSNNARNRALALMLSVGQLRQAVLSGDAFGDELESVLVISGSDDVIAASGEALSPLSGGGVMLRGSLRESFPDVARQIARLGLAPGGSEWWARTLQSVTSLVTLRRTDGEAVTDESGLFSTVAAAETAVLDNDLATAIATLETLDGAALETAGPWIAAAKARLIAEAALSDMTARALARVGAEMSSTADEG